MGGRSHVRGALVMVLAVLLSVFMPVATVRHTPASRAAAQFASASPSPSPSPAPSLGADSAALAETNGDSAEALQFERLSGADRIATAVAVARSRYETASVAVLVNAYTFHGALVAAPLAASVDGPVLLTPAAQLPADVSDTLAALQVERVVLVGGPDDISDQVADGLRQRMRVWRVAGVDRFDTSARVSTLIPPSDEVLLVNGLGFADGLAAGPLAAVLDASILLTLPERLPQLVADRIAQIDPARVTIIGGEAAVSPEVAATLAASGREVRRISGATRYATSVAVADAAVDAGLARERLWLADGSGFADALSAGTAAARDGAALVLVDGQRIGRTPGVAGWLHQHRDVWQHFVLLGGKAGIAGDAPQQIRAVLQGRDLPRGGRVLLPGHRLIALYGHSSTRALGSLGEQPIEQAAVRAQQVAQQFADHPANGGLEVLPTFEFIATVASATSGQSGLYRNPTDLGVLREALEAIRKVRGYLVLDIQPGRSDFLTESRRYESLLTEPDVGLALDPEWRMGPNDRPGQKVGSVHASEVNAVSQWLDDLVRQHALPQKLLLLHQFQDQMIRERGALIAREGLAIAVQMDGFGSRSQKLATYSRTRIDAPFFNGFKLFYDEDTNLFSPGETMQLDPSPLFVSYQ